MMTIALGFSCDDGLVLAADAELSTDVDRTAGQKAWFLRFPKKSTSPTLKVGIAGAGSIDFLRYTKDLIEHSLRPEMDLNAAHGVIQGVINKVHQKHIYKYGQPHERQHLDINMVIGIVAKDGRKLFSTALTTISQVDSYHAVGVGRTLSNFLVNRLGRDRYTGSEAVSLAAQVLLYTSRYVKDVGGPRNILLMHDLGVDSGFLPPDFIKRRENFIDRFDAAIQPVMFGGSEESVSPQEYRNRVNNLVVELEALRSIASDPRFSVRGTMGAPWP